MQFDAVPNPGPMPGLYIKYLHVDPATGFYTRLVFAQEGWADHRLAHHPCYEEAYTTQGHMEYNFGTLDLGTYFFRPARVKHGHFTTMEGGATWLLRSDGELLNWYTQNEWVRWGGEAVNYGPDGGRMTWSQSSYDLGSGPTWRTERDLADLQASVDFQHSQGGHDPGYVQHGQGTDHSLVAIAKALDAARLQGGHTDEEHGHDHGHEHGHAHGPLDGHAGAVDPAALPALDFGPPAASLEHTAERTDDLVHNWGAGRSWTPGRPDPGADHLLAARAVAVPRPLGRRRHVALPSEPLPRASRKAPMEQSDKTARQIWADVKANPNRARFGFGRKGVLVNIDLQRAYTDTAAFATAYETDPRQIEHINALSRRFRALGWPVVWTHVAYMRVRRGRRRVGHPHRHARLPAEHQGRLASGRSSTRACEIDRRPGRRLPQDACPRPSSRPSCSRC